MTKLKKLATMGTLISLPIFLMAQDFSSKIERPLSREALEQQGFEVKVAQRPTGWFPQSQVVAQVRSLPTQPKKVIRVSRETNLDEQAKKQNSKPGSLLARVENIFGGKSKNGAAPLVLLPLGCGGCADAKLTLVNTTFEPITVSVGGAEDRLEPGESALFVLGDYPDTYTVRAFGERTQSRIFEDRYEQSCGEELSWAIVDPLAALDVVNSASQHLFLCVNNESCTEPVGYIPVGTTREFYFQAGSYQLTLSSNYRAGFVFNNVVDLPANEVSVLTVSDLPNP